MAARLRISCPGRLPQPGSADGLNGSGGGAIQTFVSDQCGVKAGTGGSGEPPGPPPPRRPNHLRESALPEVIGAGQGEGAARYHALAAAAPIAAARKPP